MIETGIDVRVKIQDIVTSQLPEFILSESPLTDNFLEQFYVSQEFQGGSVDFAANLDQYRNLDLLTDTAIFGSFSLEESITTESDVVVVNTTKSFPNEWGLFKIDDEIFTYTGITTNSFTGVVRGFSGITSYHSTGNPNDLVFEDTKAAAHASGSVVENLSTLFLKEFYEKIKTQFAPGFENIPVSSKLNAGNWIRNARSFYQSKGSEESFKVLFKVLFGEEPTVIDLEDYLIKPSTADYSRRDYAVGRPISGNPLKLAGRTLTQNMGQAPSAAISEIEPFSRNNELYYKILFFVNQEETLNEQKLFNIPAITKAQNSWSNGDYAVTVDSTIGFRDNGKFIISDGTEFTYEKRSVNQFLGVKCSDVTKVISIGDEIIDNIHVSGLDTDGEEVSLFLTGVIANIDNEKLNLLNLSERIFVDNLGSDIKNDSESLDQIIANSFVYNTSVVFKVRDYNGGTFNLEIDDLDNSSLKLGDLVDITVRGSFDPILSNRIVEFIDQTNGIVNLSDSSGVPPNLIIDIRRVQSYANSSTVDIEGGNGEILSNITNLYDAREFDNTYLVATNGLPSYEIDIELNSSFITDPEPVNYEDFDSDQNIIKTLVFNNATTFISGDLVQYTVGENTEPFFEVGEYFVEVLPDRRKLRFYLSPSFISTDNLVGISSNTDLGQHNFSLVTQANSTIVPNAILKQIPIEETKPQSTPVETPVGSIGILVNGLDVSSYKSSDRFFIGPITNIQIASGGSGWNVVSPPSISISEANVLLQYPDFTVDPELDRAKATPALKGKLTDIIIDPQNFDISDVFSITVTGGNSTGAIAEPIISRESRKIPFDTRNIDLGGGIDPVQESITFQSNHNLSSGQVIRYNNNGQESIGVGSFGQANFNTNRVLANNGKYFAQPLNNTTIELYPTLEDLRSGINTVGFTSDRTGFGLQSFDTLSSPKIIGVNIIDDGGDFFYRKLNFQPDNVFEEYDEIRYNNHGFSTGEIVIYETEGTVIGGLSTEFQYYVEAVDSSIIKLAEAGIGGTNTDNFDRKNFVKFTNSGVGTQSIRYQDIVTSVNVSYASSIQSEVVSTPIIRGELEQIYIDKGGVYGSDILNFQRTPQVNVIAGSDASLQPIVSAGVIVDVQILDLGQNYSSSPILTVVDNSGQGSGGIIRAIVENGKIADTIVINSGSNYSETQTRLIVTDAGIEEVLLTSLRSLTVNLQSRNGYQQLRNGNYSICSYDVNIRENAFEDFVGSHSPIIGWANDGNPIYGGFAYSDPENSNSQVRSLLPSYKLDADAVNFRPSQSAYLPGFFIEDYQFDNSGDLDRYNGRYGRTPEFPNGVYAYFAGISSDTLTSRPPVFPYFIGPEFRDGSSITQDTFEQSSFDFSDKPIYRNTFPYVIGDTRAGSPFLNQSYLFGPQDTDVIGLTNGSISEISILGAGVSYAVGDIPIFEKSEDIVNTFVSFIDGEPIESIKSKLTEYNSFETTLIRKDKDTIRVYVEPEHILRQNDNVIISGVSTSNTQLNGIKKINVVNQQMSLGALVPITLSEEITDIFVNTIPDNVITGSVLKVGLGSTAIGTTPETVSVLNVFKTNNALRIFRPIGYGSSHFTGEPIEIIPNFFEYNESGDDLNSQFNERYYFNPFQTITVGIETGATSTKNYQIGNISIPISVQTQKIFVGEDKDYKTGEPILLSKNTTANPFVIFDGNNTFIAPSIGDSGLYFVGKVDSNSIGIRTTVNGNDVFFSSIGNDRDDYNIITQRFSETPNVVRSEAVVTTVDPHNLTNGDLVNVKVTSDEISGVDKNPFVKVIFNEPSQSLLIDPRDCQPADVNLNNNTITIIDHNFQLGDYILYHNDDTDIGGLISNEKYYTVPVDSNIFQLAETFEDVKQSTRRIIDFTSVGVSTHFFSLVNPKLIFTNKNSIKFNLTDPSLLGSKFNLYFDQDQTEIFENNGVDNNFTVVSTGVVGEFDGEVLVNYSENNPKTFFYGLEIGGYISTSDTSTNNYNTIEFNNSAYQIQNRIEVVGINTFEYSLFEIPEKPEYTDNISYETSSNSALGGITKVQIVSGGNNFKSLPEFISVQSEFGRSANLLPVSKDIGNLSNFNIVNPGWDYSADTTLTPEGIVQPIVNYGNGDFVTSINVLKSSSGYSNAPDAVLVDSITREAATTGDIEVVIQSNAITDVNVLVSPTGLTRNPHELYTINNSNAISIQRVVAVDSVLGIATFRIQTPINGFGISPVEVGDEVYVENVFSLNNTQTFLNSSDNGYSFFEVIDIGATNPFEFAVQYPPTTQIGVAATFQNSLSGIINRKQYAIFEVNQATSLLSPGERLSVKDSVGVFIEQDLFVSFSNVNYFKIIGSFSDNLLPGDVVRGNLSGIELTVVSIDSKKIRYKIDSTSRINNGWDTETGFLNLDTQALPDNDYYQNLSYSIRSDETFETIIGSVNSLVHPSGLKNFSETSVESTTNIGLPSSTSFVTRTIDLIGLTPVANTPLRVDRAIFDLGFDDNISFDETKSPAIRFQSRTSNKRLTDFTEVSTNRVLLHDDISGGFSDKENAADQNEPYVDFEIVNQQSFHRVVLQTRNPSTDEVQFTEAIMLFYDNNAFTMQKAVVVSNEDVSETFGFIEGISEGSEYTIRFNINEELSENTDFDLKIYDRFYLNQNSFIPLELFYSNINGATYQLDSGEFTEIFRSNLPDTRSVTLDVEILDSVGRPNYYEVYAFSLAGNSYSAVFGFDADEYISYSGNDFGNFTVDIDSITNELTVSFLNDSSAGVNVNTRVNQYSSTPVGIQTYRFIADGLAPTQEQSLFLTSNRVVGSADSNVPTTIWSYPAGRIQAVRSVIFARATDNSFAAFYQVMSVNSSSDAYSTVYPFIVEGADISPEPGIGTFQAQLNGGDFQLVFTPDPQLNNLTQIEFIHYDEAFYRGFNVAAYQNIPLLYGNNQETYYLERYNAPFGNRADSRAFTLTYQGIPIYEKSFNPVVSIVDDLAGVRNTFNLFSHFFSSGEKLIYKPGSLSSFGSVSPIQVQVNGTGPIFDLPEEVFAVKRDLNRISISTSFQNAVDNIFVTVVGFGDGDSHTLTMEKKLEKSVITVNGVLQSPISQSNIPYEFDTPNIGLTTTFAVLTGIGTLQVNDILLSNDEFVIIDNVGFGEDAGGPITNNGTLPLVEIQRGTLGSISTSHSAGDIAQLYRGSYNIVGTQLFFTQPPRGAGDVKINDNNLVRFNSSYQGRTFLQQQYDQIILYDDISAQFDGVSSDYTITSMGSTVPLVNDGSGLLLINDLYQTPTTDNNEGNNYFFESDDGFGGTGITTVVFTGITSSNGERVISEFDVNQNQVPRGGLIVSLGSTPGLGYAPLFGAAIEPIITGGVITGIRTENTIGVDTSVRWAYYDNITGIADVTIIGDPVGSQGTIVNADYNNTNGLLEIETNVSLVFLGIEEGDIVVLSDLLFECSSGGAPSQQIFPDENDSFIVQTIIANDTFTCVVGASTIPHTYISGGTVQKHLPFEFGVFTPSNPDFIYLAGLGFTCPSGTENDGQSLFPEIPIGYPFTGPTNAARWNILVGASSIPHTYDPTIGIGTAAQFSFLNVGSGYRDTVSIAVTDPSHTGDPAVITGRAIEGGELEFTIVDGGTGYTDTTVLSPPEPNYDNLPVTGIFRRSVGFTTETGLNLFLTLEVGAASTTAIGRSEFFEVKNFNLTNQGFSFFEGDIITAVGVPTAKGLTQPIETFQLTVLETFTDNFAAWNFGELDYIDSIKEFQDGVRTRFAFIYQGEQFSFEQVDNPDSQAIDLDSLLLIFVNTVLQVPGVDYIFEGGSSFSFTSPPTPQDDIAIYFYRGKRGIDSLVITDVDQTVRPGDDLQLLQNNQYVGSFNLAEARAGRTQNIRRVNEITSSSTVSTPIYTSVGDVTETFPRQIAWDKQKKDLFLFGEPVYKFRDSIESIIRPKQRFIRSFNSIQTNDIFLNNGEFFLYEEDVPDTTPPVLTNIRTRNVQQTTDLVQAEVQVLINSNGQVNNINVIDPGFGYVTPPSISLPNPVGLGTTTRATAVSIINGNGEVTSVNVNYAGTIGAYDQGQPPTALVEPPTVVYEDFQLVGNIQGFSGIITAIQPGALANTIVFSYLTPPNRPLNDLANGYSVVIFNTVVGDGVESLSNDLNTLVGVGTQYLDCVYEVTNNVITGRSGTLTVNVQNTNLTGITISGTKVGEFSWGRFSNVNRDLDTSLAFDVDGTTYTEAMENYPSAVRISEGLRQEGGLARVLPPA